MWVGTQTSQVEIKLSLKACQVRMGITEASLTVSETTCPSIILDTHLGRGTVVSSADLRGLPRPTVFLTRYTSSTYGLKNMSGHVACAWSAKVMSSAPSPAASTPGARSAKPQPRQYLRPQTPVRKKRPPSACFRTHIL